MATKIEPLGDVPISGSIWEFTMASPCEMRLHLSFAGGMATSPSHRPCFLCHLPLLLLAIGRLLVGAALFGSFAHEVWDHVRQQQQVVLPAVPPPPAVPPTPESDSVVRPCQSEPLTLRLIPRAPQHPMAGRDHSVPGPSRTPPTPCGASSWRRGNDLRLDNLLRTRVRVDIRRPVLAGKPSRPSSLGS